MSSIPDVDLRILDEPYDLSVDETTFYGRNAFVKLKDVLPRDVLDHFRSVIEARVLELCDRRNVPLEERGTYHRAFLQVANLWTKSDEVKKLVFSRRIASIAAGLMGVEGVRLYHDQALYKEPSGGHTPWHADQYYWPLATDRTTTVWIPLQETPLEMGPLEFAAASHKLAEGRDLAISDESESRMSELLNDSEFQHVVEPFDAGEVSFHSGWLFHRAGPNTTSRPRNVMCVIYMAENMRLAAAQPHQVPDQEAWCPGVATGEVADSPLNPVLYSYGA